MDKSVVEKTYYPNGNIQFERYYMGKLYHRENGPAVIWHDENGRVSRKTYYIMGRSHRESGPAWIYYNEDGSVESEYYYLNGKPYTKDQWYQRLTAKQKVNLLYGKGDE